MNALAPPKDGGPADRPDTTILFNACKGEVYGPGKGYRSFARLLKKSWTVNVNKEGISEEKLKGVQLIILPGSREPFDDGEIDALKKHMSRGGSILILTGEGGEKGAWSQQRDARNCNLKSVIHQLSDQTIELNADSVVRTVHYKYFHPKEVHVGDGVVNRGLNKAAKKIESDRIANGAPVKAASAAPTVITRGDQLSFVYPNGGTLSLQKPAVPLLSSGYISYPLNRPICAVYEQPNRGTEFLPGRLMCMASLLAFEDKWMTEEENSTLAEVLTWWLLHHSAMRLNQIDAEDPEVSDYLHLPDVASLAERVRVCLESPEDLPRDATTIFDLTMFRFDTDLIPEAVKAYEQTNVKHEPLTLIQPEFSTPLPPFYPATVPPIHREPPPPALDQFDLDAHFASEKQRLAILTNKCQDKHLEYYIKEAADIMGLTQKLAQNGEEPDAKTVIEYIFKQIVQFKKLNHEELEKGRKSKPSTPVTGAADLAAPLPPYLEQ
ncbi:hypothetical protein DIPPA_27154 [Diplonema papillatum]|nr:hypothetical protein DIPPA_27154 [Diplonema papillatum]